MFKKCLLGIIAVLFSSYALAITPDQNPFSLNSDDSPKQLVVGDSLTLEFRITVPSGYFVYHEKTSLVLDPLPNFLSAKIELPPPQDHFDKLFGKNTKAYLSDFSILVKLTANAQMPPGSHTLKGTLRYQGCSDEFCYLPVKQSLSIPLQFVTKGSGAFTSNSSGPSFFDQVWNLLEEVDPNKLLDLNRGLLLLLAFLAGMVTCFTPCVLPIIPLTMAYVGALQNGVRHGARFFFLFLGMAVSYSLLGLLAASLGLSLGFLFQSRIFLLVITGLFLLFAFSLFGWINLALPTVLQNRLLRLGGNSNRGAFLVGLTFGLVASPCVGPLVGPFLIIAAKKQSQFFGFALLLSYGLGMGLLFFVLANAYGRVYKKLKGPWVRLLKNAVAITLLFPAFFYGYTFYKTLGFHTPQADFWIHSLEEGLAQAAQEKKPILIDFYADWCPPCLELEHSTFSNPQVQQKAKDIIMIKVDCTLECEQAQLRYSVVGMPTILFLDHQGNRMGELTVMGGSVKPQKIISLMDQALEKNRAIP